MVRWPAVALALCLLTVAAGPATVAGGQAALTAGPATATAGQAALTAGPAAVAGGQAALTAGPAAVAGGGAAGPSALAAGAPTVSGSALAQQFDRAQFRLTVHPNGSARWTFHYERTLANESERQQFEGFAETFNEDETRLYTDFQNQSRTLASRGEEATARSMAVGAFSRRAFVSTQLNDVGVVEMGFTWQGFGRTEGERVVVGDVFEGGLYVGQDQSLVVHAGDGLSFQSVEPQGTLSGGTLASSDTVTWSGERTFVDNHPRVVLGPAGAGIGTTVSPGTTSGAGDGTATPTTGAGSPFWPVLLVVAVVVTGLGVILYRRRSGGPAVGISTGTAGTGPSSSPSVDELALLDDEERVAGMLREHGGRMRQSVIVEQTGWSKSKVSMVLSEMAEDGEIRKLRVGRENIISLPGHEPDAARSSLDDDE